MAKYEYTELDQSSNEIRLVTILPGKFDDPIRIEIKHAQLVPPIDDKPKRLSLKEIQKTLPEGWNARENLEGRVFFTRRTRGYNSWCHPVPDFPRSNYDPVSPENRERWKQQTEFEALSYTWGSTEDQERVLIENAWEAKEGDVLGKPELRINKNLAQALQHLRYEDKSRVMWIDALCINQTDTKERNHQVKRMGLIYRLAWRVVAWLGPSLSSGTLAFSTLGYLGCQVECTPDNWLCATPGCRQPDWFRAEVPLPYEGKTWDAIVELIRCDWFRRLWVVQEIHLGSKDSILQCGHDEILWSLFRRAILSIEDKIDVPEQVRIAVMWVKDMCQVMGNGLIELILHNHRWRQCENARDHVYGLLNLVPPEIAADIEVYYDKEPAQVFEQVFLARMGRENRLCQLPYSGLRFTKSNSEFISNKEGKKWPTWLPDWSCVSCITVGPRFGWCASGISASRAKCINPGRLKVTALPFAAIKRVEFQIKESGTNFKTILETCRRLGLAQLRDAPYPKIGGSGQAEETYRDAWLQTIIQMRTKERFSILITNYNSLAELSDAVDAADRSGGTESASSLSKQYLDIVTDWAVNYYLFTLGNGYVGMIHGQPQQRDEVYVILGCNIPMLLRPTPTGEYEVIGDCYVHGIMDGEALLGSLPYPWRVSVKPQTDGQQRAHYINLDTGVESTEDPRMNEIPLLPEWEMIDWERTVVDPYNCKKFRNKETGEKINSDPRLFPEALMARGVPLRTITLV